MHGSESDKALAGSSSAAAGLSVAERLGRGWARWVLRHRLSPRLWFLLFCFFTAFTPTHLRSWGTLTLGICYPSFAVGRPCRTARGAPHRLLPQCAQRQPSDGTTGQSLAAAASFLQPLCREPHFQSPSSS